MLKNSDEWLIEHLLEEIDELENYSEKLRGELSYKEVVNEKQRVLLKAMWVRIVSEYPQGGFPDMGLIKGKLFELGIEVK